jgi:hypothetical protein
MNLRDSSVDATVFGNLGAEAVSILPSADQMDHLSAFSAGADSASRIVAPPTFTADCWSTSFRVLLIALVSGIGRDVPLPAFFRYCDPAIRRG